MVSDSSLRGFAVHLGDDWAYGSWENNLTFDTSCGHCGCPPTELSTEDRVNINVLELWPVIARIKKWCKMYSHHKLIVVTDNLQVLAKVKTGRSINSRCMQWLSFWVCVEFDIDLEPKYIRSAENIVADTLSRVSYAPTVNRLGELLSSYSLCCKNELVDFFSEQHGRTSATEEEDCESFSCPVNVEEPQEPVEVLQEILYTV